MRPAAAIVTALLCAGCGRSGDDAAPAERAGGAGEPPEIRSVALVDPLPWSNELGSGTRHRVQVRTTAGIDTVPGIATTRAPAVDERTLHGFAVEADGSVSSGFIYDAVRRDLKRVPLPPDFLGFTAFDLTPPFLVYVGRAADGERLAAIVRRWPDGALIYRSEGVEGYPSDAANSEIEWGSRDSVEIRIRLAETETAGGTWLRVRGAPGGSMTADTVLGGGG